MEPTLIEPAWWAFVKLFHEDHANAAMHQATVRYSPLTMNLALALRQHRPDDPYVVQVINDEGVYPLDPGR